MTIGNMTALLTRELAAFAQLTGTSEFNIVETGTIRNAGPDYRDGDGWSTLAFGQHVTEHGGSLVSIDLDTSVAARVLADNGLAEADYEAGSSGIHLVRGYSVSVLAHMAYGEDPADPTRIHVLLLDSDNDSQLILHEFMVARPLLATPALLLVDDVDLSSARVEKGHMIAPFLDEIGIDYRVELRGSATHNTGVLIAVIG